MNRLLIVFTAAICMLASCDELEKITARDPDQAENDSIVTYVIPTGSHYSKQSSAQLLIRGKIKFKVRFDSSAIYQTRDKNNQADINKLYGMSDCGNSHQVNSARFGWRWYNNRLEILAYSYINGQRQSAFVAHVPLNTYNTYEISFGDASYKFTLNSTSVQLPRSCSAEASGYKLFPYFGGDEQSPHEIKIQIQDLE